ncbi:MAG: chlorinating enzyme [Anaerolineae bacterium]
MLAEVHLSDQVTISQAQVEFYRENGYLVIENLFSPAEVDQIKREAVAICRGERGKVTGAPRSHPSESDDEVIQRVLCLHHPHKLSPVLLDFMRHPNIAEVLTGIIGPDVKCMQSMLFIKAAGKPGQAWHQDEDFIPTRDRSLTGAWMALDDATVENGCLWVIPGSHRPGVLWPLEAQQKPEFDCADEAHGFPYSDDDAIPVELKAGSAVFFNGYLLHRSLPNQAKSGYRRALVNHYMSASSLLPWLPLKDGEFVATADCRDIVMVAGKDPYAYKGLAEVSFPHIRPNGKGGCKWPIDEDEEAL